VPKDGSVLLDAAELVKCSFCAAEAFVLAEMTAGKPVPLCADCFAIVEPDVIEAARDRRPSDGPAVRLVRRAANDR
jgi:hypothetical protein